MSKAARFWLQRALLHYGCATRVSAVEMSCLESARAARAAVLAVHVAAARQGGRKLPLSTLWKELEDDGLPAQLGADLAHAARVLARAHVLLEQEIVDGGFPAADLFDEHDVQELRDRAWAMVNFAGKALLDTDWPQPVLNRGGLPSLSDAPDPVVPEDGQPAHALQQIRRRRAEALKSTLCRAVAEQAPQTSVLWVLLYGSWARSDFDGCSDVDLIVIRPDEQVLQLDHGLQLDHAAEYRRLDVITTTGARWAQMTSDPEADPTGFARAAAKEGLLIWSREGVPDRSFG